MHDLKAILESPSTRELLQAHIFSVMRALKRVNAGDQYYEAYLGHLARQGEAFTDVYMLQFALGKFLAPKRILEIGTRTGISLCQLLTGFIDLSGIEKIHCVDPFDDGFLSPVLVKKNLDHLNLPSEKVTFMQGYSQDVLPALIKEGERYDYILVDGDHSKTQALDDLRNAERMLDVGGIILFDDISQDPGECGLITVWEEWQAIPRTGQFEFKHDIHGKGVAWAVRHA